MYLAQAILDVVKSPTLLFRVSGFNENGLQMIDKIVARNELAQAMTTFNPDESGLTNIELAFGNGETKAVEFTIHLTE